MGKGAEITKQILLLLLAGSLTTSPRQSQYVWKEFFRLLAGGHQRKKSISTISPAEVMRRFSYLKKANLLALKESPDGKIEISLSKLGRTRALKYKLDEIQIPRPKRWVGKWRIIIFDIPESSRKKWDIFRHYLKQLGFLPVQKSAWIYPFPCENELDFLAEILQIDRYLLLATASLRPEEPLREWFDLR